MSKKIEKKSPKALTEEELDKATGGGVKPLIQTSLDDQGTTTTSFHGSDFNAAKNRS